jgi:hypothetical protein
LFIVVFEFEIGCLFLEVSETKQRGYQICCGSCSAVTQIGEGKIVGCCFDVIVLNFSQVFWVCASSPSPSSIYDMNWIQSGTKRMNQRCDLIFE